MSIQEIRGRAERLGRAVDRRNLREYVAAAIVIPIFAVRAWFAETGAVALGCWLVALAALWVVYHLHRRGTARRPVGERGASSCLEFHRSEIVRQRDLLRGVWSWYLLPFVPGMLFIILGRAIERPDRWALALGAGMVFVVTFVAIGLLNQRGARKLQRALDEIDALRQP